ncbi:hypothetical protein Esti_005521 [Eimeria stiedai]
MTGPSSSGLFRCVGAPVLAVLLFANSPEGISSLGDNGGSPAGPGFAQQEKHLLGNPFSTAPVHTANAGFTGSPEAGALSSSVPSMLTVGLLPGALQSVGLGAGAAAGMPLGEGLPASMGAALPLGGAAAMSPTAATLTLGPSPMQQLPGAPATVGSSATTGTGAGFGFSGNADFLSSYGLTPSMGVGAAPSVPWGVGSLRAGSHLSQHAMAASLPVHVGEAGDVLNASLVSDTQYPVGFHSSLDGTYAVPRFPSAVHNIRQPTAEMIKKCILRISANRMTNGFSDTLKSGGVQVLGNAREQLLRIIATSSPRFTSKIGAPYVLFQRAMGVRQTYELKVSVPRGCVLLPNDSNLMTFITRMGKYITDMSVRLQPDTRAVYTSSVAAIPADILTYAANLPQNSNFQPVGHCVFIAHFMATPENVKMQASHTEVLVEVAGEAGLETLGLEIPVKCLPQSLQRIAMWTAPMAAGTAVIVAFSPPPHPQSEWFLLRSTSDENEFNTTSSRAFVNGAGIAASCSIAAAADSAVGGSDQGLSSSVNYGCLWLFDVTDVCS